MPPALPKLSYVLLSHNREKYIRQAIESAFAQDYEGELEYIFSDDCSTDRTYEIIKECVAAYKGNVMYAGRRSPNSLYSYAMATMEADYTDEDYNQDDASGFIHLNGLRLKQFARVNNK